MRKCDECQEPLETTHKGDMYAHKPCNECKWGMFSVIPNLPDHFRPKKKDEKSLSLPFLGKIPDDYGFRLICGNCGSDDVTFLNFNKITNDFGTRCWYCEAATRLFDKNSWVRDLDDCGMNNYKHITTGEIKDYYQLEEKYKKEMSGK